jgi:lysophospholipase L1-like esterase
MQTTEQCLRDVAAFWESGQMNGESILPMVKQDGDDATVELAFVPAELPRLEKFDYTQTYEAGRDFTWAPGTNRLIIPTGSRIKTVTEDQLYRPANSQQHGKCRDKDCDIFFGAKGQYRELQTAVTYTFDPSQWHLAEMMQPTGSLPNTAAKLNAGQPVNLVLMGDSITTGCDASGKYNVAPYAPGYGQLIADALTKQFNCHINAQNLAVGGKTSDWGIEQIDKIIAEKPDLVILAFGMNDASHQTTAMDFQSNIRKMIVDIQSQLPATEFVLIATMTANAEWMYASPELYPQYRQALNQLQKTGLIMADVFTLWDDMVKRKGYLSFTANGLNHPNDFGHRLYAQVIWSSLLHTMNITSL